ncbi:MAG: MBL fold metallo-hydrolase, partial [Desulfobacterales bacterium]|nr:MBL fold metallo-hydrolase [Desulfobacterales bacterium]NIX02014.1 MBL fold metallo-hydrolase [Phycisphaerae bacterium]
MRVKWLGHACFLITSRDGLRVITDPYAVGGGINYSPIKETADIITVSH